MRLRWGDNATPATARLLIHVLEKVARAKTSFVINSIPMNVNNQLVTSPKSGKRFLDPKIREWRKIVDDELRARGIVWKPTGVTAAILVFESPLWVTKKREVRKADADNRVKATLDAVALTVESDDAQVWEGHFYKLFSRKTRTHVWIYDLGDVVEALRS